MQKALITGPTSGIGYELALLMASKGHDLVLVSRSKQKLIHTQHDITSRYDVDVSIVVGDLSQPGSAKKLYETVKDQGIEILVNNAGVGLKGNFFDDDLADTQRMAYLNMNSLMDLTHYFGNDFIQRKSGKILNIGSIVAFFPGPKQPVYYATKAFVRSLSRALAYNTKGTGVNVTALHPGVTRTGFFVAAGAPAIDEGASPAAVARLGYNAMMAGKIEVTYGLWNKFLTHIFVRITPYRIQAAVVDKSSDV